MLADGARGEKEGGQPLLGGLGVTVDRNHFGTQLQSFEATLQLQGGEEGTCSGLFIRAPLVVATHDPEVRVLATLPPELCGADAGVRAVAVQRGATVCTAFHPELTGDVRWHARFAELCRAAAAARR